MTTLEARCHCGMKCPLHVCSAFCCSFTKHHCSALVLRKVKTTGGASAGILVCSWISCNDPWRFLVLWVKFCIILEALASEMDGSISKEYCYCERLIAAWENWNEKRNKTRHENMFVLFLRTKFVYPHQKWELLVHLELWMKKVQTT